jgi:gamma-D-glutamyl-L-lysine dipeptidyl-peptidase
MRFLKYLVIALSVLQITGCKNREVPSDLKNKVDSLSAAMVPQPMESLCDLSLTMSEGGVITVMGKTNLPEARDKVIGLLERSGYKYKDSIAVLPDTSVIKKPWGLVTVSVCNMRTEPSNGAEMATQPLMGTPVKILDRDGGWLFVQTPDSYLGWTGDDAIAELSDDEMIAWKGSDRVIFLENTGVITDSNDQTVSDIVFGCVLKKTGEQKDFYMVVLPDGREGRIRKNEASDFSIWAEKTEPRADLMVAFARTMMGTPYLWGGTSTKGVDCSGFTKTVYLTGGVILARDASSQYRYGIERSIDNGCDSLATGDLLFFGRIQDGKKRITHTGMYIGDTEFIHSSGMVRINSLDSTRVNYSRYRATTLLGARRIIGATPGKGIERVSHHCWYF